MWASGTKFLKSKLLQIIPADIKRSVAYDIKKNTGNYVNAMLKMCRALQTDTGRRRKRRRRRRHFLLTRTSNVPCHAKLDTEAVTQILVPAKERTEARKLAGTRETNTTTGCGARMLISPTRCLES